MWARAQMRGGALVQGTGAQNSGEGVQAQRAEKGGIGGGDTGAGARGADAARKNQGRHCSAQEWRHGRRAWKRTQAPGMTTQGAGGGNVDAVERGAVAGSEGDHAGVGRMCAGAAQDDGAQTQTGLEGQGARLGPLNLRARENKRLHLREDVALMA